MIMRKTALLLATIGLFLSAVAFAKKDDLPKEAPKIFQDVVDCKKIADSAQRLACYDTSVAKLESAQSANEVYVVDKEQVKESRKGLFGFSLPKIKIFGSGDDDKNEIKEIDAVVAKMRQDQNGWVFTLEDGAIWRQTDGIYIGMNPKVGNKIHIKKAAFGSYMGKVENGVSFRIARVNTGD
jgi:hypothetical protein